MKALTFFFKGIVTQLFPEPLGPDDRTFRELLVKVWNEILVRLKESHNQLTGEDLESIGFGLRRVYFVAQAYKAEHETYTSAQWIEKLIGIAKESGVSLP